MVIKSPFKTLTRAPDLPSYVPTVPVFDGEESFDATKVGGDFLQILARVVRERDWDGFAELFDQNCFWKDRLTLTFDRRTLFGKKAIVEGWKETCNPRKPVIHTDAKDYALDLPIALNRLAPTLASLDVPFCFSTEAPKTNCVGLAKLIPQEDKTWKIWVLSTAFVSLTDHPSEKLPRTSPSLVADSQRGKSKAQGLPRLQDGAVLDAVVVGASASGVATATALDSLGASVIAFDSTEQAGGNWSGAGKAYVTLHHLGSMMNLPQYPVPDDYPEDMCGKHITRYISSAVEALKLPVFCGVSVVSNSYDDAKKLWTILVEDVKTKEQTTVTAKNLVLAMGSVAGPSNPRFPQLTGRELFKGPVQHAAEYKDATPFKDKNVVIVGASNSAHDIARNLAEGGAKDVTILQRGPTAFYLWENISPVLEAPFRTGVSMPTADFLFSMMPLGIGRGLMLGAFSYIESQQDDFYAKLESKGYSVERNRDFVTKTLETRNGSFFMDRQKSLELVFNDRVKVARGTAIGYADGGLVVRKQGDENAEKEETVIKADGIVLATGFEDVDLPQRWIDNGFLKSKFAADLENPSTLDIDQEGEYVGIFTDSGHPHLYVSSLNVVSYRWVSDMIAAQIIADLNNTSPATLSRQLLSA